VVYRGPWDGQLALKYLLKYGREAPPFDRLVIGAMVEDPTARFDLSLIHSIIAKENRQIHISQKIRLKGHVRTNELVVDKSGRSRPKERAPPIWRRFLQGEVLNPCKVSSR